MLLPPSPCLTQDDDLFQVEEVDAPPGPAPTGNRPSTSKGVRGPAAALASVASSPETAARFLQAVGFADCAAACI